jgi:hypothetical protein
MSGGHVLRDVVVVISGILVITLPGSFGDGVVVVGGVDVASDPDVGQVPERVGVAGGGG